MKYIVKMADGKKVETVDIEYGEMGIRFTIDEKVPKTRFIPYAAILYVDHFD